MATMSEIQQAARNEAQEYINKAKELTDRGISVEDAHWATAYATIALAVLALVK